MKTMKVMVVLAVVLALFAMPVFASASAGEEDYYIKESTDGFFTYKFAVDQTSGAFEKPAEDVEKIPAAGLAVSGLVAVLATLGCAVLPKK